MKTHVVYHFSKASSSASFFVPDDTFANPDRVNHLSVHDLHCGHAPINPRIDLPGLLLQQGYCRRLSLRTAVIVFLRASLRGRKMIQYQLFNADAGVRYFLNLRWGIDGMVTGLMGEDFSPITWQPYRIL